MRLAVPVVILLAFACAAVAKPPETARAMIPIADEISADNLAPVKAKMEEFIKKGDKIILLDINSPGGFIQDGWDFVSYLKNSKKANHIKIQCLVDNHAASMAAVILESACDERWMVPQGYVLFHGGSTQVEGRSQDLRSAAMHLDALNHGMSVVVAKRLGMSLKDYEEKIRDGNWTLNADDALAAHAIDKIVDADDLPAVVELPKSEQGLGGLLLKLLK